MRLLLILPALLLACGSDDGEPSSCSEAACDGAADFCVLFGSDIAGEPDVASCEPLPTTCTGAASCDCVEAGDGETDVNLDFCIGTGGCQVSGDTVEVICPGG